MRQLGILRIDEMPYREAWELQKTLHARRQAGEIPDMLILLSHPHVLTVGKRGGKQGSRWANLTEAPDDLRARGVELVEVDRGGDITYHGPGQLVGYPIVDLSNYGEDVGRYVRSVEALVLRGLEALGISAGRQEGFTGVWIGDEKICAIGVRIRSWITMHGFALNVRGRLEGFDWIVPCGLDGKGVTSIERQMPSGRPDAAPSDEEVVQLIVDAAAAVFDLFPVEMSVDAVT